jgi:ATP-dependent DNA helicase DinG
LGRLIRSKKDKGMAVILDNRVLGKSYGRAFLKAMPPAKREIVG